MRLSVSLCELHYNGRKDGLLTELGKYFQHFLQNDTIFLKLKNGNKIYRKPNDSWVIDQNMKKIVFDNTTVLKKTAWPTGNSNAILSLSDNLL